jgi:hypothetical protein
MLDDGALRGFVRDDEGLDGAGIFMESAHADRVARLHRRGQLSSHVGRIFRERAVLQEKPVDLAVGIDDEALHHARGYRHRIRE